MNNPESPSSKTEPATNPQHQKSDTATITTATKPNKSVPTTTNQKASESEPPVEHGGPKGLEPTRYGDWERNGRCTDF